VIPSTIGKVYCIETVSRSAQSLVDVTIVARVNLTNAALTVVPPAGVPTKLHIIIEDGLLTPLNPAFEITAGTVTIVGTDTDDAALTEIVDCSAGLGHYKTTGLFKTVTTVTAAAFDYLLVGDEKITVKRARMDDLDDLNLADSTFGQKMLHFYPGITEKSTVEVFGLFWEKTLNALSDSNFWTEQEPDVLEYEISKRLEIPLRNRAGLIDWGTAIQTEIARIDMDYIESIESHTKNTMVG